MDKWSLKGFIPSQRKHKKYAAVLINDRSKKEVSLHFGDDRYEQYKDSTGLGKFSHLDHGDKTRRESYRSRHKGRVKPKMFSPGYFALQYLW